MQITTHLHFNGQCAEAFKFYEQCFNAKITTMMTYKDSPLANDVPPESRDKIVHATVSIGDCRLTGADAMPTQYQKPQGFSVLLNIESVDDAERIFKSLSEQGVIQMAIQKTFWAKRFGMVTDRFGTPWMLNCEDTH